MDKRRQGHNVAEVMNLIGDVKGKVAIMVDDMIDTAGGEEETGWNDCVLSFFLRGFGLRLFPWLPL